MNTDEVRNESRLFGCDLSKTLESRILEYVDLKSLTACRLVNSRWRIAVDSLSRVWIGLTRRLGITDACEGGRERWRAQRMLGDCWVTCSFCPIIQNSETLERDLKLISVKVNGRKRILHVMTFGTRSAAYHNWRLHLQLSGLDLNGSCECLTEDWMALLSVKETPAEPTVVEDSNPGDLADSESSDSVDSLQDPDKSVRMSLLRNLSDLRDDYKLVAVVPISRLPTSSCVSPLALIQLPVDEQVCSCVQCDNCAENRLLLLTDRGILLYILQRADAAAATPSVFREPQASLQFQGQVPQPSPLCLQSVSSTQTDSSSGTFLVYLKRNSQLEEILTVDQVRLDCRGLQCFPGQPLAGDSCIRHTLDSDMRPVFLFSIPVPAPAGRKSVPTSKQPCWRLQLVRYVPARSGEVAAECDPCEYDNPFDVAYHDNTRMLSVTCFTVGRLFWCSLGCTIPDPVPRLAIHRIGCPELMTLVKLDGLVPLEYLTAELGLSDPQRKVSFVAASWIDCGFEPDSPDETPLLTIFSDDRIRLRLGWHCSPPVQPPSVLSEPIRLSRVCFCD